MGERTDRTFFQDAPAISMHRPANSRALSPCWSWVSDDLGWKGLSCRRKLQRKVNGLAFVPIHDAQIDSRTDLADFVANVFGNERCLRVVEHDALLVIEPTRGFIDLRNNRIQSKGEDSISQRSVRGVKGLSLPHKNIDQRRDLRAVLCAGSDDCSPLCFPVRDVTRRTVGEQAVKVFLRHRKKLRRGIRHRSPSSIRRNVLLGSAQNESGEAPIEVQPIWQRIGYLSMERWHWRSKCCSRMPTNV